MHVFHESTHCWNVYGCPCCTEALPSDNDANDFHYKIYTDVAIHS